MYINDNGGKPSTIKGTSDCGVRAVAIACELDYVEAQRLLRTAAKLGKAGNGQISKGIYKEDMTSALAVLGWHWVSAPKPEGRKARYRDLPKSGRYIARMAKHYAAVVDGNLRDSWDSSHKMVYGYWSK